MNLINETMSRKQANQEIVAAIEGQKVQPEVKEKIEEEGE